MADAKLAPKMPQWMVDHTNRYLSSGGTDGHMYSVKPPGMDRTITVPSLLLITKGRKSGEKFLFPLFYGTDGASYVIIASKGGAPEHPGWYKNLLADPVAEVQVGTQHLTVRARTIEGAERERLWTMMLDVWPPYADYKLKTDRQIPVVVLDPVG